LRVIADLEREDGDVILWTDANGHRDLLSRISLGLA
jgi:hypothetical protein